MKDFKPIYKKLHINWKYKRAVVVFYPLIEKRRNEENALQIDIGIIEKRN